MPADGKAKSAKTNFLKLDSCNAGDWSANRKLFFLLGLRPLLAPLMHVKLRRIRDRFDESAFPATTLVIEESHDLLIPRLFPGRFVSKIRFSSSKHCPTRDWAHWQSCTHRHHA